MKRHLSAGALVAALLLVQACEPVEDKAERLYQESILLAADGEPERAIVTLKSVFDLNGQHRDARMLYADLVRTGGRIDEAYGQYLLVAEQFPQDFEARMTLAEMALEFGNWPEVTRHAEVAREVDPEDLRLRAVQAAIDYRDAVTAEDAAAQAAAIEVAVALRDEAPENMVVRRLIIDGLVRDNALFDAIEAVDAALALKPLDQPLNQLKLSLMAETEDMAGLGEQLQVMVDRFPDDREIRTSLVRWYLASGDLDGAEAFVRRLVEAGGDDVPPKVALVQFLRQVRSPEAAVEELDRMIEDDPDTTLFQTMRASLRFDAGEREEAIASIEALLNADDSSDDALEMKVTLARMRMAEGETDAARALVDEVLASDDRHVDALKMKANWLIDDDLVRDAVLALRTALDQSPQDAEAMTILARAYERDGNRELMGESSALAFDASGAASDESLRYARYLVANDEQLTAEDVLLQALRLDPSNLGLLQALAEVYVFLADWPRTEQVVEALRRLETDEARRVANGVEATLLQRMERTDESISLLQNVISDGEGGTSARAAVIRTHLENGNLDRARTYVDEEMSKAEPGSVEAQGIKFLNAALMAVEGQFDAARQAYRELIEANPKEELLWRALIATSVRQGDGPGAEEIADEAIAAVPGSPTLLWIKAGMSERRGDIDGAIEIYERLYETNSNSTVVANNLASLLTTHRDDEASLERAYVIARRLRGSTIPAFQDTYGWIAFQLGNLNEALEHLEPAATGLPGDPAVQYHLAQTYDALERPQDALSAYKKAVALWGDTDQPRAEEARAAVDRLESSSAPAQ